MEREKFVQRAKELLGKEFLKQSGAVLYSSSETLERGEIYLLGTNPGGRELETIGSHLDRLMCYIKNQYVDEDWNGGPGKSRMQEYVKNLMNGLNLNIREICSSNLIFKRTAGLGSMSGAEFYELADICWKAHRIIIQEIVKPKVIIAFGNGVKSAYGYIFWKFKEHLRAQSTCASHYKNWICKAHQASIEGMKITVIGVPHLSYYNVEGKVDVVRWLKENLKEAGIL